MTAEQELDIYKERYKAMKQLAESAYLIIDMVNNKNIPNNPAEKWLKFAEAHGVGDRRPQQIHKKDYNDG